jgi:hypothetical protein
MNFRLRPIEIGERSDGKAVTACVVDWVQPSEFEEKLTPAQQACLAALDRTLADKTADGKRPAATHSEWAATMPEPKGAKDKLGAKRSALTRSLKALIHMGLVAQTKDGQYVRTSAP